MIKEEIGREYSTNWGGEMEEAKKKNAYTRRLIVGKPDGTRRLSGPRRM
jgi:hypothetical protein